MNKPLQISRRGGAALLHQIVSGHAEERILGGGVYHGVIRNVLVDAPGARNGAEITARDRPRGQRAGVNIEHTAADGSTRPQACHLGHLGSHPTAYIVGIAQRRKLTIKLGHSHRLADAGVEVLSHQIHQTAPRIIGDFRVSLPR